MANPSGSFSASALQAIGATHYIQELRTALVAGLQSDSLVVSEETAGSIRAAIELANERGLTADRIEPLSSLLRPGSVANDFHDAITTVDLITVIELTAEAVRNKLPTLPAVRLDPPEIEYGGKVFIVDPDHALAFKAIVEGHPDRVGLTTIIGAHPERKMVRLPAELKAIVDTNRKGSRLMLS